MHLRIERRRIPLDRFVQTEPRQPTELPRIRTHHLTTVGLQHEPQRHIRVTVRPPSLRHRQEERLITAKPLMEPGRDTQLLPRLPHHGHPRIFPIIDMTTRQQPTTRFDVINHQHATAILVHQREVHRKMLGRHRRWPQPKQRRSRTHPLEDRHLVISFATVVRRHRGHLIPDYRTWTLNTQRHRDLRRPIRRQHHPRHRFRVEVSPKCRRGYRPPDGCQRRTAACRLCRSCDPLTPGFI